MGSSAHADASVRLTVREQRPHWRRAWGWPVSLGLLVLIRPAVFSRLSPLRAAPPCLCPGMAELSACGGCQVAQGQGGEEVGLALWGL